MPYYLRLENQGSGNCHKGSDEKSQKSRGFPGNHKCSNQWSDHKPGSNAESAGKVRGELGCRNFRAGRMTKTHNQEDANCNDERRNGSLHHIANVSEERGSGGGGCQSSGVGQGRNLVPEICSRNDGTGCPSGRIALSRTYSYQGHTYGGDCGPGTAGHNGYQCANHAAGKEKNFRGDDVHSIVNHHRDYAADHPASGNCPDQKQDEDCRTDRAHIIQDSFLQLFPADFVE